MSETENSPIIKKSGPKSRYEAIEVSKETKKKILTNVAILNRKELGKPVTPDEYLAFAVSLVTSEHLEQLKNQSLTNQDRLQVKYREYCKSHGKVSMDNFIGILLQEKNI
jgi:hypothetical protein